MSWEWEKVEKEKLVMNVRFEEARRSFAGCWAYRAGQIYEQADGGKQFRWELIQYEPDVGDPYKDTRVVDGGRARELERAQLYCEDAFNVLTKEEGPLYQQPPPKRSCYNCEHCRAPSEAERKEERTQWGVCALGHEVLHMDRCDKWEPGELYRMEVRPANDTPPA